MKILKNKRSAGFTLLELLISVAIVAILAAIAVPSYLTYVNKARFSEAIQTADSLKTPVASCLVSGAANCSNGNGGVPAAVGAVGNVTSATVSAAGIITVTASLTGSPTYILTPTLTGGGQVTWGVTGTCLAAGLCN